MASHPTVRDHQEGALILANGAPCRMELLHSILEWQPLVIALDGALERLDALGLKADVVLGDFDSAGLSGGTSQGPQSPFSDELLARHHPIEVVHVPDQELTDLDKGIAYAIGRGIRNVFILWATGLRADHTMTNLTNLVRYAPQATLLLLDDHSRVMPLLPLPRTFSKWYAAGTPISLIPVGRAMGITTTNLAWALDDEELVLGHRTGSSNRVAEDGLVTISYQSGDLLLMECWDAG